MKRIQWSDGQMFLLHLCCVCNVLVPRDRALEFEPESDAANWPLHPACVESERRWSRRARAYWAEQDAVAAAKCTPTPTNPTTNPAVGHHHAKKAFA
jgi:hypothetical protein